MREGIQGARMGGATQCKRLLQGSSGTLVNLIDMTARKGSWKLKRYAVNLDMTSRDDHEQQMQTPASHLLVLEDW